MSATLDHLIYLVPSLPDAIASFRSQGFTIFPGGRHLDLVTENALIVFPTDTIYFEILAFVSPSDPAIVALSDAEREAWEKKRREHWWSRHLEGKEEGWIDWSIGVVGEEAEAYVDGVNATLGEEERYDMLRAGGRRTKEGKELKWRISRSGSERVGVGRKPFFCVDLTPREWRVPPPTAPHPNGSFRISEIVLLASSPSSASSISEKLDAILRSSPGTVGSPVARESVKRTVKVAETEEEREWVKNRGEGLYLARVSREGGDGGQVVLKGVEVVNQS
ncbi:hypothetical protein BT69DRAFT_1317598 [Atractiella rhizophila]|nr:hypothetical protein BT69DRAFT_1317598 [Atractiella rhizophila]